VIVLSSAMWTHAFGVWIVPAIFVLGVMAAIALPAYQDYVKRAATAQTR